LCSGTPGIDTEKAPPSGATRVQPLTRLVEAARRLGADSGAKVGSYALLAVSDTGTGLDKESANNLFEPGFTTKQKGRASGFGLETVRHTVTEAGGWITFHGEPGKGVRIEIYLPQGE
jgi:signal transduction histidine kinase